MPSCAHGRFVISGFIAHSKVIHPSASWINVSYLTGDELRRSWSRFTEAAGVFPLQQPKQSRFHPIWHLMRETSNYSQKSILFDIVLQLELEVQL